jgi:bifunctional DNA-binding transcriptional regulator/antitoxin component of YhaV-PrlF toxin-antitoxin module
MPKAEIRDGKLTIPLSEEVREKLDMHDGDEFEAHILSGSVILRPVSGEPRERAWERIFSIIDQVRLRPGQPEMTAEEVEEMIVEEVKAVRRARSAQPHDD